MNLRYPDHVRLPAPRQSSDCCPEVITARAPNHGNPAPNLQQHLFWLEQRRFYAEAYGFGATADAAANTAALLQALTAAVGGGVVILPAGNFPINGVSFPGDDIALMGAGMPWPNAARTGLIGGTVLRGGTLDLARRKRCAIRDLGVDVSGVSARDAIRSGVTQAGGNQEAFVANVTTLGSGTRHGCVLTSGDRNVVYNFRAHRFEHGLVFRCGYSMADQIYSEDCTISCMTVKAVQGETSDAVHNLISNLSSFSTTVNGAGGVWFHVDGASAKVKYNQLVNYTAVNTGSGIIFKAPNNSTVPAMCEYNTVTNAVIDKTRYQGVQLTGSVDHITLSHVTTIGTAVGFHNYGTGRDIALIGCQCAPAGSNQTSGVFSVRQINGEARLATRARPKAGLSIPPDKWVTIAWRTPEFNTANGWSSASPTKLVPNQPAEWRISASLTLQSDVNAICTVRIVEHRGANAHVVQTQSSAPVWTDQDRRVQVAYEGKSGPDLYYTVEALHTATQTLALREASDVVLEKV